MTDRADMKNTCMTSRTVYVARSAVAAYPTRAPFHPSERYPELSFLPSFTPDITNTVYASVRRAIAGVMRTSPGDASWRPLAALVRPGDTVVVKPNFIKECHETRPDEWQQVITHGSVIRAVCDYVLQALEGRGRIIICDAPQTDSSFHAIGDVSGTRALVEWYQTWADVPVDLHDLRQEEWDARDDVIVRRRRLPGDPLGYVAVNVGQRSAFYGNASQHGFYGADYETDITRTHHHDDVHEYLLSRTVMDADVVINLPKLKTHKKTGITCALKNLVGINGDKNWLPHYVLGTPDEGGDQFPARTLKTRVERAVMTYIKKKLYHAPAWVNHFFRPIKKAGKYIFGDTHRVVRSGNWYGNDTTWRMVHDLNVCFFYWSQFAQQHGASTTVGFPRRYLALVDGIIAGEGEGPLAPDAVPSGIIIGGLNPIATDAVCAWLMGFDPAKIRLLTGMYAHKHDPEAYALLTYALNDIDVLSDEPAWQGPLGALIASGVETYHFTPHFGWRGAIERTSVRDT